MEERYYCNPVINQYRQHPLDYMESMELAIKQTLSICPEGIAGNVVGIILIMTGSTPILLDRMEHFLSFVTRVFRQSLMPCLFYGKIIRL